MMDLAVKVSLENALDNGWKILSECFEPDETSFRTDLIEEFWPIKQTKDHRLKTIDHSLSPDGESL